MDRYIFNIADEGTHPVPTWQIPSRRTYGALRIAQRHPTLFQRVFRKIFPAVAGRIQQHYAV